MLERRPLLDLAADPDVPAVLFATTPNGELVRSTNGGALTQVNGAPQLGPLDWQPGGPLVGVGGAVMVSADRGTTWAKKGAVEGQVEALDVTAGRWHVATDHGVFESTDDGKTWRSVLAVGAKH